MYIAIAIITLAVIAATFVIVRIRKGKRPEKLSKLAGISLAFIGAGVAFGENLVVGYGLILVGIAFAVADIVRKKKAKDSA